MSLVLGVIGEAYSGKDTMADYLVSKYGAFSISHSKVLDQILDILDLSISRRNEIDLGMALRQPFGPGIVAQGLRKQVLQSDNGLKVIQSIRFPEEVQNAKGLGAHLIYIDASPEVRFKRSQSRTNGKADDKQTWEQFQQTAQEPTEKGIKALAGEAEFIIDNDGSLEQFYDKIEEVLRKLGK
jgi:dephospho-CoA kinase